MLFSILIFFQLSVYISRYTILFSCITFHPGAHSNIDCTPVSSHFRPLSHYTSRNLQSLCWPGRQLLSYVLSLTLVATLPCPLGYHCCLYFTCPSVPFSVRTFSRQCETFPFIRTYNLQEIGNIS